MLNKYVYIYRMRFANMRPIPIVTAKYEWTECVDEFVYPSRQLTRRSIEVLKRKMTPLRPLQN